MGNQNSTQEVEVQPDPQAATPANADEPTDDLQDVQVGLSTSSRNDSAGSNLWNWGNGRTPDQLATPVPTPGNSRHGGVSIWDWGAGRKTPPSAPSSLHGGTAFAGESVDSPSSDVKQRGLGGLGGLGGLSKFGRNDSVGSSLWNWGGGRTPDEAVTPSVTPGNSRHGGVSLWDWGSGRRTPQSTQVSLHGGSAFAGGSTHGGGILRSSGSVSKGASRGASAHGGVHFKPDTVGRSRTGSISGGMDSLGKTPDKPQRGLFGLGSLTGTATDATPTGMPMKRVNSFSSMWDWGMGRSTPATTPAASPTGSRESSIHDGQTAGALKRNQSLSSIWDWSLGRQSPDTSRDSSVHGSSAAMETERDGGKEMPWAIKVNFGTDGHRPV